MDKVNLGMVGLGGWGKFVAASFSQVANCNMRYICDANPGTLERQKSQYPLSEPTNNFQKVLDDPDVDAVALATPAPFHFDMAKAVLNADKHAYVEKPLALKTEHAEELVDLADKKGLKLMVGHLLEYHPAINLVKQQIEKNALGDVHYIYCQRLNLGVVRQQENAFWSLAPHDISVILYLFDEEPNHITVSGEDFLQTGIEDVVFANLRFPSGRLANIHVSWLDPHKKRSMVVVGSEKMLVFDDMEASEKVRIFDKGAQVENNDDSAMNSITVRHGDIYIPHISNRQPLAIEVEHFINCIREDRQPRSDGRDGLRVVRILEQVENLLADSRPVILRKVA